MYNWAKENLKPEDGGWLAGLIAGEGCFQLIIHSDTPGRIRYITPKLDIQLRADDRGALEEIKRLWQIDKRIYRREASGKNQAISQLQIYRIAILRNRIIPTFRLYPLRAKKQRDFEIWAEAVEILYQKQITKVRSYKPWEMERLLAIADGLKKVKEFTEEVSK
jgi:hypothetical protein